MTHRASTAVFALLLVLTYPPEPQLALTREDPSGAVPDSSIVKVVPPEGGVVELPGFARVRIGAGAFEAPESLTVRVTNTPSTSPWLNWYGWGLEGKTPYLGFDLRVSAGHRPAAAYQIEIILPPTYLELIDRSWPPKVFREFIGGGPEEALRMYEELPSELDWEAGVIRACVVADDMEMGMELRDIFIVGCCAPSL